MSSVSTLGVQSRQLKPSERWICFAALFFLGFTATFNQFKAAPAIQHRRHDRPLDRLHPYGHRRSPRSDGHPRNRTGLGPREPKDRPRALTMAFATGVAQVVGCYIVSPIVTSIGYQAVPEFVLNSLALLAAVLVIVFVKSRPQNPWGACCRARGSGCCGGGSACSVPGCYPSREAPPHRPGLPCAGPRKSIEAICA